MGNNFINLNDNAQQIAHSTYIEKSYNELPINEQNKEYINYKYYKAQGNHYLSKTNTQWILTAEDRTTRTYTSHSKKALEWMKYNVKHQGF